MFRKLLMISGLTLLLGACGSQNTSNYQVQFPPLDIMQFMTGQVKAWGIVQDLHGQVVQRFTVDIHGERNDKQQLVLDERFTYLFGQGPATRTWTLTQINDGQISGHANDILTPAEGQAYGNAFNFVYQMMIPVGDHQLRVTLDDWFYAFDENTLLNRSDIKKFGITVAEVTIFMQRQSSKGD